MPSLRKNFFLTLLSQLLVVLTPLIVMPFVARRLQVGNVGVSSFTESVTSLFALFALFGCSIYGQRAIAYCKGDVKARLKCFLEVFASVSIPSLLSLGAFIGFICFQTQYQTLYWIQVLELVAFWWDVSWYYQGCETFKTLLIRTVLVKGLTIVLIFLCIHGPEDLACYVFIRSGMLLIGSLFLVAPVFYHAWRAHVSVAWRAIPTHLKGMFFLFLPSIAITVYTVLDKTMIGVIVQSPVQSGCYEEAIKVIRVLLHIVASLSIILLPRIATLYAQGAQAVIIAKVQQSLTFVYALTFPMVCGLFFVAQPFIPWFLGPGYEGAISLVQVLSVLLFFIGLGRLLGTVLIAIGKEHLYTRNIFLGAIVNFGLNLFLIPRYQALGAAWASVIAEATVTGAMFFACREVICFSRAWRATRAYVLATGGMAVALWQTQQHIQWCAFAELLLLGCVGVACYGLLLGVQRETFFMEGFKRGVAFLQRRRV
jgi:O-antigen/teichoic acid export membrane protein